MCRFQAATIGSADVRFGPKADIGVSFDDFVGTGRYCPRDFDIKRIGRA